MTNAKQDRVFAFLADPATHGGATVQRIDTHAASVFLAGDRAMKVKRAVRFPFLDYSTLEKRKAACKAELAVNRAFAPDLYLGVEAITEQADGALALGGDGAAVEWFVEMRRFDEARTLDHLADAGDFDRALAERLARIVAKAHGGAAAVSDFPWLTNFDRILAQNEQELAQHSDVFSREHVDTLTADTRANFARVRPLMEQRQQQGFVRRCHGDLHLGNIVMVGDTPTLFDAIEFSDAIATIDVVYDLAFLLMDLVERDLAAQATACLNRYLATAREPANLDALALLPLFMSVRAAIRAKVTAARLADAPAEERGRIAARARAYFDFACRLIAPPPAMLVAVGGLSGTGKTVLAQALAPSLSPLPGAVVLRSDVERKMLFGVAETERLPQTAYASEVRHQVYDMLERKAAQVLGAGHTAIVDAVFAREDEREAIERVAATAGVRFAGLFLDLSIEARKARLAARVGDASDAVPATADVQQEYDLGQIGWARVDASGEPAETFARACEVLKTR